MWPVAEQQNAPPHQPAGWEVPRRAGTKVERRASHEDASAYAQLTCIALEMFYEYDRLKGKCRNQLAIRGYVI